MAEKKRPRKRASPNQKRNEPSPDGPSQEHPRPDSHGREHEVHKEILDRRMKGGRTPDPAAYRHALEQWKKLPGSIVRPSTDVSEGPGEDEPAGKDDTGPSEEDKAKRE